MLTKIINHEEPSVSLNRIYQNKTKYFINSSETVLAFKLIDAMGNEIDDDITYTPHANVWSYNVKEDERGVEMYSYTIKDLNISKCGKNFSLDSPEFNRIYKQYDLSHFYCLNPGQVVMIENPFGSTSNFSYMNIYFTRCHHREDCKNSSRVDLDLSSYYAAVISTQYYADSSNYEEPLQPYMLRFNELSSSSFYKRVFFDIKSFKYTSDDGLFISSSKTYSKWAFDKARISMDFRNTMIFNSKVLFQFTVSFNPEGFEDKYSRMYVKLPNIIANIGGFMNSLKIFCSFVLLIYNEVLIVPMLYSKFYLHNENMVYEKKNLSYNFLNNLNNSELKLSNYMVNNSTTKKMPPNDLKLFQERSNNISIIPALNNLNNIMPVPVSVNVINKNEGKLKFSKLPSQKLIFSRLLCFGRKPSTSSEITYYLARDKLRNYYLNIKSLIELRNEVNFLKQCVVDSGPLDDLFNYATKVITLSRHNKKRIDPKIQVNKSQVNNNFSVSGLSAIGDIMNNVDEEMKQILFKYLDA
jgi:hypothetical protein